MIQLYHGEGKGKTTAAVGQAVRMAGHGKKVLFTQFMKGGETGELEILKGVSSIYIRRLQKEYSFYPSLSEEERKQIITEHNAILSEALKMVQSGQVDMAVLDEITYPYNWGLADKKMIEELLMCSDEVELVCTGREPAELFRKRADYVTEMKMEKHPFERGVVARKGIEW